MKIVARWSRALKFMVLCVKCFLIAMRCSWKCFIRERMGYHTYFKTILAARQWMKEKGRSKEMRSFWVVQKNGSESGCSLERDKRLDGICTECQRIDVYKLVWRRLLRVPWTARRSNQSILKEISPEYSSVGLMLKLKLQYFGHLMWSADSLEKIHMLGKIEGRRRRGGQKMRWLVGITD